MVYYLMLESWSGILIALGGRGASADAYFLSLAPIPAVGSLSIVDFLGVRTCFPVWSSRFYFLFRLQQAVPIVGRQNRIVCRTVRGSVGLVARLSDYQADCSRHRGGLIQGMELCRDAAKA